MKILDPFLLTVRGAANKLVKWIQEAEGKNNLNWSLQIQQIKLQVKRKER
jgi:hypothetical protein